MAVVSIIIPHKNSSSLLERMLRSLPHSDYYQLIVVDDHSIEEELEAVEILSQRYTFELYSSEGYGAGAARNAAFNHIKCNWMTFLDADDYVLPEFDQEIRAHFDSEAEIVYFNLSSCYSDTFEPAYRDEHVASLFERYAKNGDENLFRCCYLTPYAKLIRTDFVKTNNIRFEEIMTGDDMWFSANTGVLAKKIEIVDRKIYMVTVSSGSQTTTLSKERFESLLQATLRTNKFLRSLGKANYQVSVLYFLGTAIQFGFGYLCHVVASCVKAGVNPFVGAKKLLHINKVLEDRQNKKFIVRK